MVERFSDQSSATSINGCYSEWLPVYSPGLIFGPLLFLLHINDLHEAVSYSELSVFADDDFTPNNIDCFLAVLQSLYRI